MPDVNAIADQLVTDYRTATVYASDDKSLEALNARGQADLDAIGTMDAWVTTAQAHGEEFTEDDWIALVQELARCAAGPPVGAG